MSFSRTPTTDAATRASNYIAASGPLNQTASIDLHGLSEEKARNTVLAQIKSASEKRWDRVRFITGRGNHVNAKGTRGTLYKNFQEWLKQIENADFSVEQFDGFYEITFNSENEIFNPIEAFFNEGIKIFLGENVAALSRFAANKDFDAMMAMALCYDKGIGVDKDYKSATALYKEIADTRKDSLSQFETGCRYFIGTGVRQNDIEAVKYLELSAAQGYVLAEFLLGTIFQKGTDVIKIDLPKALNYYMAAAKHKHAEAARKAGNFHFEGIGTAVNFKEAIKWWTLGEKFGDPVAAFNLIHMYEQGKGTSPNSAKADECMLRSAELGDRDGEFLLGLQLFFGFRNKSKVDTQQGLHWLKLSANKRHPDALFLLYQLAMKQRNRAEAGQHLIGAAEAGNVEAQYHIVFNDLKKLEKLFSTTDSKEEKSTVAFSKALQEKIKILFLQQDNKKILETETIKAEGVVGYLMTDDNNAVDLNKGISLLKSMADNQSTWALYSLSGSYLEGHGSVIKINPQLAYHYLMQGEKLDDGDCLSLLGRYWAEGLGTHLSQSQRVNPTKALTYYNRAAKKNNPLAYNGLGNFYHPTDLPKAIGFYQKAMELSLPNSQAAASQQDVYYIAAGNIGRIYFKGGEDLPKDEAKAFYYFDIAAVNGCVNAAMFLFDYYYKNENMQKFVYYLNIAARLGDERAQEFMRQMNAKPEFKALVESFINPQASVANDTIIFDTSYSLRDKVTIADIPFITQLKARSSLGFFAVKNSAEKIDAVVQCKEPQDYTRVNQLQAELSCTGKFFKNAKKKKKYFVIEGINSISSKTPKAEKKTPFI
jgi:TPR repeat protein